MKKISVTLKKRGILSKKEADVLLLLCKGMTRQEIANDFYRSLKTINAQVESISRKLECHSTAEIIATAVGSDMVLIEISHTPSHGYKFVMLLLMMLNIQPFLTGDINSDMRRGPRSPRPVNSMRLSGRFVRATKQL